MPCLQLVLRRHLVETLHLRRAADHEDLARVHVAALERHLPVALVGGDHHVRGAEGGPLQPARRRGTASPRRGEPRQEQLRHQVVLVEDELRAAALEPARHQEQQVRRVAGVHHVDRPDPAGQPEACATPRRRTRTDSPGGPPVAALSGYRWIFTPSISAYGSRSCFVPCGQMTCTSQPASRSALLSCHTRRSNGTDRFSTRMSALPAKAHVSRSFPTQLGVGEADEVDDHSLAPCSRGSAARTASSRHPMTHTSACAITSETELVSSSPRCGSRPSMYSRFAPISRDSVTLAS